MNKLLSQLSVLGKFWEVPHNLTLVRWNVGLLILQIFIILVDYSNLPPQIPLYYTLPWGELRLASTASILILPGVSFLVMLLNGFSSAVIIQKSLLFSRSLVIVSLIFSFLALVALLNIALLV